MFKSMMEKKREKKFQKKIKIENMFFYNVQSGGKGGWGLTFVIWDIF